MDRATTKLVLLPAILVLWMADPAQPDNQRRGSVEGRPGFLFSSTVTCTIRESSVETEVGRRLTFVDLLTDKPTVVFESENGPSASSLLAKVHDSERVVTLVVVASGTGSVDSFVIDKSDGTLARAAAGSVMGVYADASLGNCE